MNVKDSTVNYSQHQQFVLSKTRHLNLLEQIIQAQFVAKRSQKEKEGNTYYYLHAAFPKLFTWKYQPVKQLENSRIIYSDNAKTFTAAKKWTNKISKDKQVKDYLVRK